MGLYGPDSDLERVQALAEALEWWSEAHRLAIEHRDELMAVVERLRGVAARTARHLRNLPARTEGDDVRLAAELEGAAGTTRDREREQAELENAAADAPRLLAELEEVAAEAARLRVERDEAIAKAGDFENPITKAVYFALMAERDQARAALDALTTMETARTVYATAGFDVPTPVDLRTIGRTRPYRCPQPDEGDEPWLSRSPTRPQRPGS